MESAGVLQPHCGIKACISFIRTSNHFAVEFAAGKKVLLGARRGRAGGPWTPSLRFCEEPLPGCAPRLGHLTRTACWSWLGRDGPGGTSHPSARHREQQLRRKVTSSVADMRCLQLVLARGLRLAGLCSNAEPSQWKCLQLQRLALMFLPTPKYFICLCQNLLCIPSTTHQRSCLC